PHDSDRTYQIAVAAQRVPIPALPAGQIVPVLGWYGAGQAPAGQNEAPVFRGRSKGIWPHVRVRRVDDRIVLEHGDGQQVEHEGVVVGRHVLERQGDLALGDGEVG